MLRPFNETVRAHGRAPFRSQRVSLLQINVGRVCNLACKHCHVEAHPGRTESMAKTTMEQLLRIAEHPQIDTIDITGGAPELNPHLDWLLDQLGPLNKRLLVRSNLVVLEHPDHARFIDLYRRYHVELITSLPHLDAEVTDNQRGENVYENVIAMIKHLNDLGYAMPQSGLYLHLVHNPAGAYLPASQALLEQDYKARLWNDHQVRFNHLFVLNNFPVGRFRDFLVRTDNYDDYMCDLITAFNPTALDNAMCRTTLSVRWDGRLFDCDFNQMLDLPIAMDLTDFNLDQLDNRAILTDSHCYACTAGAGASCQGQTV